VCALECPAEGFLGIVANPAGDNADAEIGRRQEILGKVHPPLGEVPDRRPAEDFAESGVEHGPRHGGLPRQCGHRPPALGRAVQQGHGGSQYRVIEGSEPAPVRGGRRREMETKDLNEQQLRQA
jgi:hypothetical protein